MTPERIALAERVVLVVGAVAMVLAVVAFDWRVGLFLAGVFLAGSALDIRWRRT